VTTPALLSEKLRPLAKLAYGAADLARPIGCGINGFS